MDDGSMPAFWWMNFIGDGEAGEAAFLGSAVVEARSIEEAVAFVVDSDPGRFPRGVVHAGLLAPWLSPDPADTGRFLEPAEARALAARLAKRRLH